MEEMETDKIKPATSRGSCRGLVMHGGRLGGDQALGSCRRRTPLPKLGSVRHSNAGSRTPWSHDFAAPVKNIGMVPWGERHLSNPPTRG
jgi:hypothetical protein